MNRGKAAKALYLKRPHLYPILDSRLVAAYRHPARLAAHRLRNCRPGLRRAYWAAIRADLLHAENIAELAAVRTALRQDEDERVRRAADLSDIRLLDIVVWSLGSTPSRAVR